MKVTIKWTNPKKKESVKAFCNVELMKGSLTLYGVKIIDGKKGLFAAAQSTEKDDKYYPTAYISEELSDAICEAYKDKLTSSKAKKSSKKKHKDEDEDGDEDEDEENEDEDEDDDFPF